MSVKLFKNIIRFLPALAFVSFLVFSLPAVATITPAEEVLTEDEPISKEVIFRPGNISAGLYHTLLCNEAGEVYAWGDNTYGQLGIGEKTNEEIPMLVEGLSDIVAVSAGDFHSLALSSSGDVFAWGRNTYGQLGNGSSEPSSIPVRVNDIPPVMMISAGGSHSVVLGLDGKVYAWGMNTDGQVGNVISETINGTGDSVLGTRVKVPAAVAGPGVVSVSAGGNHSLYLNDLGEVFAWGSNEYGQLGDGTYVSRSDPAKVNGISGVISISAGYQYNLAVTEFTEQTAASQADSAVGETFIYRNLFSWGSNSSGQLGLGHEFDEASSVNVPSRVDINGDQNKKNDDICQIDAGYSSSVATLPAGDPDDPKESILVWGNNSYGQLGIGNMPSQNAPVKLIGTSNGWTGDTFLPFQSVSAGGYHLALLSVKGFAGVAGRADKAQLGNVSSIASGSFLGVRVSDAIAPEWTETAILKARVQSDSIEFVWEHAFDNVAVTGYLLTYMLSTDVPETVTLGRVTKYTLKDFDSSVDQVISLQASDAQGNTSQFPLEYIVGDPLTADDENIEKTPDSDRSSDRALHVWSPDLYGTIEPLEVPWDVDYIYSENTIPPPKDNSLIYAIVITASVILFFVIIGLSGFKRTHKGHSIFRGIFKPDTHSEDMGTVEADAAMLDIGEGIAIKDIKEKDD